MVGWHRLELLNVKALGNLRLSLLNGAVFVLGVIVETRIGNPRVRRPVPQSLEIKCESEMASEVGLAMRFSPTWRGTLRSGGGGWQHGGLSGQWLGGNGGPVWW